MKMKHRQGKRILSVLLLVVMIVGMITIPEPGEVKAADTNLVMNGDFETGALSNGYSGAEVVSNVKHGGTYSAKITSGALKFTTDGVNGGKLLEANKTYRLSAYVYAEENVTIKVYVPRWDSSWGNGEMDAELSVSVNVKAGEWTLIEYVVPERNYANLIQPQYSSTDKKIFYIDDITLTEKPGDVEASSVAFYPQTSGIQMVVTTDVELADSYGDWAQAEATIKVDDKDTSTTWHITKTKTLYTVDIAADATKVEIPKDTVFTIKSNGETATSKTPFKITHTISYEKQGNDWTEVKKAEVSDINMEFDAVLADGSWFFKASNIADATATYYKMTFIIDGTTVDVPVEKSGTNFVIWPSFFGAIKKGQGVPTEKLEIAAGTMLQEVDPNTTGWATAVEGGQSLKMADALSVQKMNGTWTDVSGISKITVTASFEQMYANQIGVNLTDDAKKSLSGFAAWSGGSTQIMIDESAVTVQFQLANAAWGTVCNTSALTTAITNGSVITIPKQMKLILTDSTDNTKIALLTLDFGAKQIIEKLGNTWAAYNAVHDETTVAHEISDAPYQFTSAFGAIIVKKADGTDMNVTAGSTLQTAGVYKVTRIENMEKFVQQLVLYRLGDVHTDDKYTIQDLVAAKKLEQNQTNTDPAGKYAADVNVDGDVDVADIQLLRKSLLSDDPITELKKNSRIS